MTSAGLPSIKARRLLAALERCGFVVTRTQGSHRFLRHINGKTLVFAFHDRETVGPRLLSRILKDAGISADELIRTL